MSTRRTSPRRTAGSPLAVSPDGAAALLDCSRDFFDAHVRPELRVVRRGRRILVPVAELERWLAQNASLPLEGQ